MKRALAIIPIFLLITLSSRAQVWNTDSLQQVINSDRPYEQQIDASIKLLGILEQKNETKLLGPIYNELGKLYRKTGQTDKATDSYNKAEAIYRQLRDTMSMLMLIKESDSLARKQEDFDLAKKRYEEAVLMSAEKKDSLALAYALNHLGGMMIITGKYAEAEQYLLRSLAIREKKRDSLAIAQTLYDLGRLKNKMRDYGNARRYLQASVELARTMRYEDLISNGMSALIEVAGNENNFQDAYNYFLLRKFLLDSLLDLDKTKQIEELRTQFETEEKEQRIKQQQVRLRLQNYIFIGIGGLVLLTGLLIHSQYRKNKLRQETRLTTQLMQQQEHATKAVMEAEENERQRIAKDLHDGLGQMMSAAKMNLSAFESEMKSGSEDQKQSLEKIISLVDESCKEIRTVSHVMMPNALLKHNLPAAIRDFVDKLNSKNIKVHVYTEGLDERFDTNLETVLYRVVQECVTNSIKHAGASNLDITLVRDKDGITGTIEDNGQGFDTAGKENFDGIGLKNITTRIEYLKGTVDFDSAPGRGTVVAFHVPV